MGLASHKNLSKGTYLAILHPTAKTMTKRTKKETKNQEHICLQKAEAE
jgi:hypothetical protein